MTRRFVMTPQGLFIARPGFDALDATKPRLVEPRYRMLEQHAAAGAYTTATRYRTVFLHTASIAFEPLPYVPIVQFTVSRGGAGQVIYPNHVLSETKGVRLPNDLTYTDYLFGRVSVTNRSLTYEGHLNTRVAARLEATIMKADSGLPLVP